MIGVQTVDGAAKGSVDACEVGGPARGGAKKTARWRCLLPNMGQWKLGAVGEDDLAVEAI